MAWKFNPFTKKLDFAVGIVTQDSVDFEGREVTNIKDPTDEHGVGDRAYNDARYTPKDLDVTTANDPALNAAVSTAIVDAYGGVIITLTGAGNSQTIQDPTDISVTKRFIVVVKGAFDIQVNGITMTDGEAQWFIWDGASWVAIEAVDADDITFTPTGDISATNVQAMGAELDTEKEPRTHRVNIYYVGKHGNDANDGLTPADAFLTLTAAIAAASSGDVIKCEDSGTYAENFIMKAGVDVYAVNATLSPTGSITIVDDVSLIAKKLNVATGQVGLTKTAGSGKARIRFSVLSCVGTGAGCLVTSGGLVGNIKTIEVENGYGIGGVGNSGEIDISFIDINVSGTGIGVGTTAATAVIHAFGSCIEAASGTGIYIGNVASTIDVVCAHITAGTAWNILAAGTLNVHCPVVSGTRTEVGTVNNVLAGVGIDNTPIGETTSAAGMFTTLTVKGAQIVNRTATGAADYNPSALTSDFLIAVDDTAADRAVIISTEDEDSGSTANPRVFVIKDETGGVAAHNITISLESGGNIDGAASYVMNQPYQSVTLYLDGTNGFII